MNLLTDFIFHPLRKRFFTRAVPSWRKLWEYEAFLDFNRKTLEGKNILLVGGGTSPIHRELEFDGICPGSVVNVDPYAKQNDRNPGQELISEKFLDWECPPDTWDEIWALYSLPYYCRTPGETTAMLSKSVSLLAPHGNLRIHPINRHFSAIDVKADCPFYYSAKTTPECVIMEYEHFVTKLSRACPGTFTERRTEKGIGIIITAGPDKTPINEHLYPNR